MPKTLARTILEITGVKAERLQSITEEDAEAEGVIPGDSPLGVYPSPRAARVKETYRAAYQKLWDRLNAKRGYSWDTDPWVWVVSFRDISTLIDVPAVLNGK